MTTKTEPQTVLVTTENPMQERDCGPVAESVEESAEAILTARRLEACVERGRNIQIDTDGGGMPLFVP